jgi:molybdopterin-containing oxidoreductase family membrane subunit
LPAALVGVGVIAGMWLERFVIVVGSLSLPRLDYTIGSYTPSWVEIGVIAGSFGLFGLLYFLFLQVAPIVSIWEVREGEMRAPLSDAGRARPSLSSVAEES